MIRRPRRTTHTATLRPYATLFRSEGVGELISIAKERGRKTRADLKLGICGEHGGDPASIAFCQAPIAWMRSAWKKSLPAMRSAEHTSELQSLMRTSYAVFSLKKNEYPSLYQHYSLTTSL